MMVEPTLTFEFRVSGTRTHFHLNHSRREVQRESLKQGGMPESQPHSIAEFDLFPILLSVL